jgi:hypothetical protein
MADTPAEIVISKDQAVFRLDGRGRWCNRHGVFRNPKISAYFHEAIRRDAAGYFVCQQREQAVEKVYFPYEDTALFVFDVVAGEDITLVLNTKRRLPLRPENLFIAGDSLYVRDGDERIKFAERALIKMADHLEFVEEGYYLRQANGRRRIPTEADGPPPEQA